jgi:talin
VFLLLLFQLTQGEAEHQSDSDLQKRLLAAAKMLADATTRMVEAAKACASSPDDAAQQLALKEAAQNLRHATHAAASTALRKKLIRRLEVKKRRACSH